MKESIEKRYYSVKEVSEMLGQPNHKIRIYSNAFVNDLKRGTPRKNPGKIFFTLKQVEALKEMFAMAARLRQLYPRKIDNKIHLN